MQGKGNDNLIHWQFELKTGTDWEYEKEKENK